MKPAGRVLLWLVLLLGLILFLMWRQQGQVALVPAARHPKLSITLAPDMTQKEARRRLGNPRRVLTDSAHPEQEIWEYPIWPADPHSEVFRVYFNQGKVMAWKENE